MFTFGIFTTHLPYVAVVAFYAYFLLFGVNKAANGDLDNYECDFRIELEASKSYDASKDNSNFHYQNNFEFNAQPYLENSVFKRKIKYKNSNVADALQSVFYSTHFGRPPPVIS